MGRMSPVDQFWSLLSMSSWAPHPFHANLSPSWAGLGQLARHQLEPAPCSFRAHSLETSLPSVWMPRPGASLTPQGDLGTACGWRCVLWTLAAARGTGSPQGPMLCPVTGRGLRWGPNWRRWGGAQEAGRSPNPASIPSAPSLPPSGALVWTPLPLP